MCLYIFNSASNEKDAGPATNPFRAQAVTLLKANHSVHTGSPYSMLNTNCIYGSNDRRSKYEAQYV